MPLRRRRAKTTIDLTHDDTPAAIIDLTGEEYCIDLTDSDTPHGRRPAS